MWKSPSVAWWHSRPTSPVLVAAFAATVIDADVYPAAYELLTIADVACKLRRCGSISDEQAGFVVKLAYQIVTRSAEAQTTIAAKAAAAALPAAELGKGPTIEGDTSEPKFIDKEFGCKCAVKVTLDNGTKVCHTVPSAIFDETHKGTRVRFVANIEEASWADNASFARFAHSRKAVIVSQAA